MTLKIYWIKAQAPRRVTALARHLKLPVQFIHMDLPGGEMSTPEYSALNPNRKAPTLVDGEVMLWESSAIMAWLCLKAGSDMWPATNPAEQVEVLRWLSWSDCHWSPAVAPFYFEHVVKSTFKFGTVDHALLEASVPAFERFAKVLDDHLATRDFAACGRLTIADFQLASMAAYWRESEMPMAAFAHIKRWLHGLEQIPEWAQPWPDGDV